MESERPRGIAIPAARAVAADAFLLTRNLSGTFSSGSVPIRAPLTIDDDDDDDDSGSATDGYNSPSSDASSYSKGLDSGTDEGFESVSGDADDETELEDVIVGGIRVHRLLGEEPGGETVNGSDFSGGSVIYRPFAVDNDEETSVNYTSFEEESENSDEFEGASESEVDRVSMKAKVVIPRAIVSLDDDEFDAILGSDDEVRVTKYPGDEETIVQDRALQFGDVGVVDEPGEIVPIEEEAVRMNYPDKLEDGLMSFGNIEELSLCVPPGGSNDFVVENEENFIEESMGLSGSSKQLIEEGVVQRSIIEDDVGGSIHEVEALMKAGDSAFELEEMERIEPECSGSVTGELVSTDEDMVQVKFPDDGLVSFETSLGVGPRDCNEFLVESEGTAVDADKGLDETLSQLVEQGVSQRSMNKESNNKIGDDSSCEADELLIPGEGVESRESGYEYTGNMIGKAKEHCENDCGAVLELENPECEGEPEIGKSPESSQLTPILDSVTTRNLEVAGVTDVVVSGCGSPDQKAEQEAENEGKQESEDIDTKLSLPDEDRASSLRSSFEAANESVENGEQISEQNNEQVTFQSESEATQITLGIEETMPENYCGYDIMENETQMARLIHNNTFMGPEEYDGTCDIREKLSKSTFKNYSEELSPNHSVQLISEKVKERVEKTKLLKEKLRRIIRKIDLCSENSAVTEFESEVSLAGGEHQTSSGLDDVSEGTKIMLPEQEFPGDLDFSINVLVIGKTGVGKSATVNSIFGETKSPVGAFGVTTKSANYVVGNVGGILVRILDTPGLMSSATEERFNQEVLMSIKKSMRTFPVDVILFIDRVDENQDIHLLRIITSSLGSSIWRNTIVVLTHAASGVPDSSSYKDFIAQRYSLMHQSIRQAVPELCCVDRSKMPRIVLAENNLSSFSGNESSECTCTDWRSNLLILCCSVKMGSKADSLQKHGTLVEKPLRSFTLFCSLWNVLLLGAHSGDASHLHNDLEKKKGNLLETHHEILWDEESQECLEREVKNQEPEDEERRRHEEAKINMGLEKGSVVDRVRTRRGRLGFQATKRLGIYLDTSDLHTGFSIGNRCSGKHEEQERRVLVRMRGSMSVLGLVPMFMSVFTSVYGRKDI
uniref:AIG1-type G domain-containing protein n=1 Tax=Noccaea caerulescens TaxID=107243 RepID=A0A1J3EWI8_NOCCA